MTLSTPVSQLTRVGTQLQKRLAHLGIATAKDLLFHFPFRYEDYSLILSIGELQRHRRNNTHDKQMVTVRGKIHLIHTTRSPRKRMYITEALVGDQTGEMRMIWFGQPFIGKTLKVGDELFFSGSPEEDMFGTLFKSPIYERVTKNQTTHTARIIPIYPTTNGITQKQIRFLIRQVLPSTHELFDWIPVHIRENVSIPSLGEAMQEIHFPTTPAAFARAERRMKFEELFLLQLKAEITRRSRSASRAEAIVFHEDETRALVSSLPFALTNDQKRTAWQIVSDMKKSEPMYRLLVGDVGCGKTIVAAIAAVNAALSGLQVAILAPTEILAHQHFFSFAALLPQMPIALLTGSEQKIFHHGAEETFSKEALREKIASGNIHIIIGTHALLTETVEFHRLGLVVVDEQHRFGVLQRKQIQKQMERGRSAPHFLSMTATPIPRSLALALYGDLELSMIREMPALRKPVKTRLVEPNKREPAYQFVRDQVKKGRQIFVICPLIEERVESYPAKSEIEDSRLGNVEKKSVAKEYIHLSKDIFPDLRIGCLHGKMRAKEKQDVMERFRDGVIDILISTSVIEVGVDVPNASIMMIEDAERFGLAQLHQFRGRVGRAEHQSFCLLFCGEVSEKARERLSFFEKNTDGFRVAEYDLASRGPGEVYGTTQSGFLHLRFAKLSDTELLEQAREIAQGLDFAASPSIMEKIRAWEEETHLE